MSASIPEDVHAVIASQIMAFPKGAQGEERESLRKLRDSTLLNLSLTSREVSSVSLPALYRNVTIRLLNSGGPLSISTSIPNPLMVTRSLRLDFSLLENLEEGTRKKLLENDRDTTHPDLEIVRQEDARLMNVLLTGPEGSLVERKPFELFALLRRASIHSVIIDSMPNLEYLETIDGTDFHFAKQVVRERAGIRFSRPLSGLSNLRILKVTGWRGFNATNCAWLMLFLPRLAYLKILVEFYSKDEKFFRDHHEALVGKSKIKHLEMELRNVNGSIGMETEILEKLLSATEGLEELKLDNVPTSRSRFDEAPSLLFLRSLKSSFKSLKYLCISGIFTETSWRSEAENTMEKFPVSINLKALEMVSFDCLSTRMLSFPEENSRIRLSFPTLKSLHFQAGAELQALPVSLPFLTESFLMDWIKSEGFPTTVKKMILDERPLDGDGRVIDLGEKKKQWSKERAQLLNLCRKKNLEVKVLKVGEQLPFGVMPEPEDLF